MNRNLKSSYDNSKTWCGLGDNFKKLRKHLEIAQVPFIPYIGLYLRDLIYAEELHPDKFGSKINWGYDSYDDGFSEQWRKRSAQSKIINSILRSNKSSYEIEGIPKIQVYGFVFASFIWKDFFLYQMRWSSEKMFELSAYIKQEEMILPRHKGSQFPVFFADK